MQLVSLLFLLVLLLLETHQKVTLLLVCGFENFLFGFTTKKGGSSIVVDLHHLVLLDFHLLLLLLELFILRTHTNVNHHQIFLRDKVRRVDLP